MQNRSIFPYRRHGPKKRVKHGPNRKSRGPQKGLPNSARDLLPMLQPATKALAQVLAGRAGASGQLGHARTMLAQAERMIAERAHNRLTPAEREEFFEQLARLKLTLADADAEAEVQADEQDEPKPQVAPVAQERLKEMALALSVRERPDRASGQIPPPAAQAPAGPTAPQAAVPAAEDELEKTEGEAQPARDAPARDSAAPVAGATGATGEGSAARGRNRLVLPKASADQAVQALAFGSFARRRSRATNRAAAAAFAAAAEEDAAARAPEQESTLPSQAAEIARSESAEVTTSDEQQDATSDDHADQPHVGNGASAEAEPQPRAKATRRGRKPKHQGVPEGWVIDEEGFVVPGGAD
jgi:hypothetical protein